MLIIDEAQEYTIDQESSLKYVILASKNTQVIMLGTPPTAVSHGTVFQKLRKILFFKGGNEIRCFRLSNKKIIITMNIKTRIITMYMLQK